MKSSLIKKSLICLFLMSFFACNNNETNSDYSRILGKVERHSNEGNLTMAIKELDKGIKLYSDSSELYLQKMMYLIRNKEHQNLSKHLDIMIDQEINMNAAYTYKGLLFDHSNELDSAYKYYKLGHELSQQQNLSKEESALDELLFLELIGEDSLARIRRTEIVEQFSDNQHVNTFIYILETKGIQEYKKQMINVN
ncbi:tetratricopeptide repeat protein [Aureibacter tunicatorum]|uniref:Tetratricopeptide (TPR) repeat protein n=1 Tax=Aureibacter tunicatorum TaxID=866807 RepID=A0AAE4BS54_9BACT|nr:hypothetical protein [Aureibacter tunicatorum]MDR6238002.1 tetratricopeptide (TPR) repeat protein [Aureibacter tunicatorum]BDD03035.1 hypothetical protein AUTU_05180 [Aureibacter tunicatorum]